MSYVESAFWLGVGLLFCFIGIAGKEFHFKPLGSRARGPRMPIWLARPLLLLLGAIAIISAIQSWPAAPK
jgi:hypothetical protein